MHFSGVDSSRAYAGCDVQRGGKAGLGSLLETRLERPSRARFRPWQFMIVAMIVSGLLMTVAAIWPASTEGFPKVPGGGCIPCHTGPLVEVVITATGIPAFYIPSQFYTISVLMVDSNGPATGENSFDFTVTLGTLTSSDPNVRIFTSTEALSWGDTTVSSWTIVWTAPAVGDVNLTLWGVMGDGQNGKVDSWDADYFLSSFQTVPEFSSLAIPGLVMAASISVLLRRARK